MVDGKVVLLDLVDLVVVLMVDFQRCFKCAPPDGISPTTQGNAGGNISGTFAGGAGGGGWGDAGSSSWRKRKSSPATFRDPSNPFGTPVPVALSILLVVAEQVNIKQMESLVDMGVVVMVVMPTPVVRTPQEMVPRTPEVVEVVEDPTTVVPPVMVDLV